MSKAEDIALKKYPKKIEWVGNQWDGAPFDVNSEKRFYYQQGYHQAEKDNEVTWEDINTIIGLYNDLDDKTLCSPKRACKEILKQFKERK